MSDVGTLSRLPLLACVGRQLSFLRWRRREPAQYGDDHCHVVTLRFAVAAGPVPNSDTLWRVL